MLEQASPAEHHDHGHEVTAEDTILCGIDVFGVDPPSATIVDEVQTVYGYYFCAVGRPGLPYLESSRTDGPVVVTLRPRRPSRSPSTAGLPGAGPGDDAGPVRAALLQRAARRPVADDVKRRYKAAGAGLTSGQVGQDGP